MTWVAIGVGVAGTAVSAYGASSAAKAQAGQANAAAYGQISEAAMERALRGQEAQDITAEAAREADNIKRQAAIMRGSIVVAQSGSGAVMGEGSAQAALDQLDQLSSADALAALYSGVNKSTSVRAQGRFAGAAGDQRAKANFAAGASYDKAANAALIGGLASAGGGLIKGFATPAPKTTKVG